MSIICRRVRYEDLAAVNDSLGWDNFVEGRIPSCYLDSHRIYLEEEGKSHVVKMGKGPDQTSSATNSQTEVVPEFARTLQKPGRPDRGTT